MQRKRKKRQAWRRALAAFGRWAGIAAIVFLLGSVVLVLPLRWFAPATTAFMLADDSGRQPLLHEWAAWESVGSAMPLAVVASEDQRFAEHFGLDIGSIRQSIDEARQGGRLRGASTITQQLAKNLYLTPSRSLWRKGIEAWFAVLLEACLSKRRILELYVNLVEFGPGIYGVAAASAHYFRKKPAALTDAEAALLAAVLPNPARLQVAEPSPYLRERQVWIMSQMQRLRRQQWLVHLDE
jgi:monofunctional biosynthetic peptidoglycan transglycosylase